MKNYISAAILAVGLLALGLCIKCGMSSFTDRNRVVSVRGLAEKEVKANKVTWPVVYKLVGNELTTLYTQIESTNATIIDYLTSNGLSQDEISVGAPDINDLQANAYSNDNLRYRYTLTQVITVTSEQVDLVRKLINRQGELLKKGVAIVSDYQYNTTYEYTELNSIKPDMIAEATQKAREAAEKFAEDSGSRIGRIKDAQQGQFSINDRDPYTPFIKNVRVVTYINYYIED